MYRARITVTGGVIIRGRVQVGFRVKSRVVVMITLAIRWRCL